jgi:hypothetical protein
MASIQPNEDPQRKSGHHASYARLPTDGPHKGGAGFFHAVSAENCDEHALSRWWNGIGLDRLDGLIGALLAQSMPLSIAHLRMQQSMDGLAPGDATPASLENAMHLCISAMADFQDRRVRAIAAAARSYVSLLSLQERLKNLEAGISIQQSIADRLRASASADAMSDEPWPALPAALSDLHAAREALCGARDDALLELAGELCEPLPVTRCRVEGQRLPASMACIPATGTLAGLSSRRPDVIGAYHRLYAERACPGAVSSGALRIAEIASEHAVSLAQNEVERALRRLRAAMDELIPVRASAAASEAACWKARRLVRNGRLSLAALADACRLRCARSDREIEVRGDTYRKLIDLFQSLGAGWESGAFMTQESAAEDRA